MNTVKLAYKGLHYQNFPYQLKLWHKTIARNSSRKEFHENNRELEKSTILKVTVREFFFTLPNGVRSQKSILKFMNHCI